jgi:hypothetical protein
VRRRPANENYEALPPTAGEVHAELKATGASLARAVAAAEAGTQGVVSSAILDAKSGVTTLRVSTAAQQLELVVDKDGAITSRTEIGRFPGDLAPGDLSSDGWIETESGLKYYDIRVGTGATPPSSATRVQVHYSGWLTNGKQFDSSVERGLPAEFKLSGVIPGWTEGVGSMKVGGKRKLLIPFALAYGASGGRGIPPRATLIFDVELLDILN